MPRKATKTAAKPSKAPDQGVDTTQAAEKPRKKTGRPTDYDEETASSICVRIANGQPLRKICMEEGMPVQSTVYVWLTRFPEFAEMYARAREDQADTLADEIQAIADETPEMNPIVDKNGELIRIEMHSAYIQWQKNRIDARKWVAAKLKPRKYGDKVQLSGDAENPLKVEADVTIFDTVLKGIEQSRRG
jgi:hypothetical protein